MHPYIGWAAPSIRHDIPDPISVTVTEIETQPLGHNGMTVAFVPMDFLRHFA